MSSDTEDEIGPDERAELAAFDASELFRLESIRRATMFKSDNVQKDAPFKVGETVSSLADGIQAGLMDMLAFNKRIFG